MIADLGGLEMHVGVDRDLGEQRRRHFTTAHQLGRVADLHVLHAEVESDVRRDDEALRSEQVLRCCRDV